MPQQVLFIHGGGAGAFEEDRTMVASLEAALGAAYEVRYPKMPHPDRPTYRKSARGLSASSGEVNRAAL